MKLILLFTEDILGLPKSFLEPLETLISKKIGPFISDCLITGFYREDKAVILATPDKKIENGVLLA